MQAIAETISVVVGVLFLAQLVTLVWISRRRLVRWGARLRVLGAVQIVAAVPLCLILLFSESAGESPYVRDALLLGLYYMLIAGVASAIVGGDLRQ